MQLMCMCTWYGAMRMRSNIWLCDKLYCASVPVPFGNASLCMLCAGSVPS